MVKLFPINSRFYLKRLYIRPFAVESSFKVWDLGLGSVHFHYLTVSFEVEHSQFWGCDKISNAIMATWHTQNNKSKIRNTEQVICNGKTRKSGTGKTVWYGTRWTWKHEVFSTSQKWLPTKMSWWKHNIWWVIYNSVYDKIIWIS